MFNRFKTNVARYPRTFVVVIVLLVIDLALSTLPNQGLNVLIAVGVDLVIAALAYILFMRNPYRVALFLQMLNTFEERTGVTYADYYDNEEGCGDPNCSECKSTLWNDERGQDVAEYAVMLAVILTIVIGVIHLIGSNAGNVMSGVSSQIAGS
jgi:Flp pilus assembly pilin Flp